MPKCQFCKKELDDKDLLEFKLSISYKKEELSEDYIDPIATQICNECSKDETTVINAFHELYERELLGMVDYVYVVWYEDENKGLVKSEDGNWWFNFKDAIERASNIARDNKENLFIQKGTRRWKISPDGKHKRI